MTRPLRISWSSIRSSEECAQKAALQRDGKRSKITNSRNFFHGNVVDRIMREWLDNPLIRHTDTQAVVRAAMTEMEASEKDRGNVVRWRDADDRNKVQNFCIELIQRLEPILEQHVLPHPYEHGKWFKIPMNLQYRGGLREILLTGEMDLLVQHPSGPVVWDLKGTADDQYYRKVIAQLVFYDVAIWASTGVRTHGVGLIQPMCTEPTLSWQVTDDARRQLMTRIERYAHGAWADERTCTTNTAICHWCDVKHACDRFSTDSFGTLADAFRTAAGDVA